MPRACDKDEVGPTTSFALGIMLCGSIIRPNDETVVVVEACVSHWFPRFHQEATECAAAFDEAAGILMVGIRDPRANDTLHAEYFASSENRVFFLGIGDVLAKELHKRGATGTLFHWISRRKTRCIARSKIFQKGMEGRGKLVRDPPSYCKCPKEPGSDSGEPFHAAQPFCAHVFCLAKKLIGL
jgi:hypothetical protein